MDGARRRAHVFVESVFYGSVVVALEMRSGRLVCRNRLSGIAGLNGHAVLHHELQTTLLLPLSYQLFLALFLLRGIIRNRLVLSFAKVARVS